MMKARENKLEVAEMLMLRYNNIIICGVTRNERKRGTTKLRELSKKGQESEVVWTCEGRRGALHRKEGDGNGSPTEEEERQAEANMVV